MANVFIDRTTTGEIAVRVISGIRTDKTAYFSERAEAETYAERKMGKRGTVISTLDMTEQQLAAHKAREARAAAILQEFTR